MNDPGSVASYDTRPGNEVGLFYNDNKHGPRNPHVAPNQVNTAYYKAYTVYWSLRKQVTVKHIFCVHQIFGEFNE